MDPANESSTASESTDSVSLEFCVVSNDGELHWKASKTNIPFCNCSVQEECIICRNVVGGKLGPEFNTLVRILEFCSSTVVEDYDIVGAITFRRVPKRLSTCDSFGGFKAEEEEEEEKVPDLATQESSDSDSEEDVCLVCLEVIDPDDRGRCTTPDECGSLYHFHCLCQWVEQKHNCPTCRRRIVSVDYIHKLHTRDGSKDYPVVITATTATTLPTKRRKRTHRRIRCTHPVVSSGKVTGCCTSTFSTVNSALVHLRRKHSVHVTNRFVLWKSTQCNEDKDIECNDAWCSLELPRTADTKSFEIQKKLFAHLQEKHSYSVQHLKIRS